MAALPSFATVAELADWLGESITAESADNKRAEGALRMASALVRTETGKSWCDSSGVLLADLPDALGLVTLQAAGRAYVNPDGLTSERVDDAQVSRKVEESGVYLTSSERDLLQPLAGRAHRGMSVVRTYRGDYGPMGDELAWLVNGPDLPPDAR